MATGSRGSGCSDNELLLYLDGMLFPHAGLDTACAGETHIFSTTTTLREPVTYQWTLDGIAPTKPIMGTESKYAYKFDDKNHQLYLVAYSASLNCGIQVYIKVNGRNCPLCKITCALERVFIPAGVLTELGDEKGNIYSFVDGDNFECGNKGISNKLIVEAIKRKIKFVAGCQTESLDVKIEYNRSLPLCLMLSIIKSPIRFKYIKIGQKKYQFSTETC